MKFPLWTLFFLLAAGEVVIDLAKGAFPRPKSSIEELIYPIELNHNFTLQEICLVNALAKKLRDYTNGLDECTGSNNSLAEIRKCGKDGLANEMAHNTLQELLYTCSRPSYSEHPQIHQEKICHMKALISYLEGLSTDAVYCSGHGVCNRCMVVKQTLGKLSRCPRNDHVEAIEGELMDQRRELCAEQPMEREHISNPSFKRPLEEGEKCNIRASLKQYQDILAGVDECSLTKNFVGTLQSCPKGGMNDVSMERLNQICSQQVILPKRELYQGQKCFLETQIKQYQALLDGATRCSALEGAIDGIHDCPEWRMTEVIVAGLRESFEANCQKDGKQSNPLQVTVHRIPLSDH